TIIVPHFGDQPFWGARVETLGVGPAPIPAKALTTQRLAVAVRAAVEDPGLRDRAAKVGALLRAEMGTLTAAKLVEQAAR
ncbi:MAG TPA: hypothetical protein VER79_00165, partial [Candidatus Limnocylindrales bacterium]|nr:hypothetical protein [Candidatus Limnocylindrales bacterium]